mmetsp:Transcript_4306/g.10514  ORF Transcript_4306/g.10514 Transcript_4306/m.10514 type:complete len:343 (-) Transcript_4306:121-1149(-)
MSQSLHTTAIAGLEALDRKLQRTTCGRCWLTHCACKENLIDPELLRRAFPRTRFVLLLDPFELRRSVSANTGKIILMWGGDRVVFGHDDEMRQLDTWIRGARSVACLFPNARSVPVPALGAEPDEDALQSEHADAGDAGVRAAGDDGANGNRAEITRTARRGNRAARIVMPDLVIIPDGDWTRCRVMMRRLDSVEKVQMWRLETQAPPLSEGHLLCGESNGEGHAGETEREGRKIDEGGGGGDGPPGVDAVFGRTKKYFSGPEERVQTAGAFYLMVAQLLRRRTRRGEGLLREMAAHIQHLVRCYHKQINRVIVPTTRTCRKQPGHPPKTSSKGASRTAQNP